MPLQVVMDAAIPLLTLALALLVDITAGEPPEKVHLTVWIGKATAVLERRLTTENTLLNKINGVLLGLSLITLFVAVTDLMLVTTRIYLGLPMQMVVSALLLKMTFAIKSMRDHALPIADILKKGDLSRAKLSLQRIVRRNTAVLDEQRTISAAVESVAEGTVDGITSPLFYFAIFGVHGAVAFRVINTLDSMIGYKDREHADIGWFSAKLDTFANYVPARLTALLIIMAAFVSSQNWRNAWRILARDRGKTESLNAGWPMSAMAGLLNVQLEKTGSYVLGDCGNVLSHGNILTSLHIMRITAAFFVLTIIPIILLAPLRV